MSDWWRRLQCWLRGHGEERIWWGEWEREPMTGACLHRRLMYWICERCGQATDTREQEHPLTAHARYQP